MTTEKAIELLEELDIEVWNEDSDGYDYSQAIRMATEALQAQQWIPVNERLPDDVPYGFSYSVVIFCTQKGDVGFGYYDNGARVWCSDTGYFWQDVIAWMPLPEPWKGEQND